MYSSIKTFCQLNLNNRIHSVNRPIQTRPQSKNLAIRGQCKPRGGGLNSGHTQSNGRNFSSRNLSWVSSTGCVTSLAPKHISCSQPRRVKTEALFTGIVQGRAVIAKVVKKPDDFVTFTVQFPPAGLKDVAIGASVALNGTCLTVTEIHDGDVCCFDLIKETLRATNLGDLEVGSEVNFERSARMGDEIGGHHVSGHVDCKVIMSKIEDSENNRRLVFTVPGNWMKYILPKGFIGIDGCSLTIGEVEGNNFSVYLIPETLRITVFGMKVEGDTVNIEVDRQTQAIVDTVERYLTENNYTRS